MSDQRPVNLDLTTISFPAPAIASILHRISGVVIFLALPILLWLLHCSLASAEGFEATVELLQAPLMKLVLWGIMAALIYHLVAGIRHMLMDIGLGESLEAGRRGAFLVFAVAAVLIVLAGVWIW